VIYKNLIGDLPMKSYVFVKIGGSFITNKDKPVSLNYRSLQLLYEIVKRVHTSGVRLIMGNGGGSFAHYTVLKHRDKGSIDLLVKCHEATRSLNRIIVDYLVEGGLPVTSIQTSAIIHYMEGAFRVFYEPVALLVELGVIPILYGECIPSMRAPIVLSTERVFELLAGYLKPERIVLLTDVSGVYTCDPKTCSNPELIHEITPRNLEEVLELLKRHEKSDATGGVYGKVLLMSKLAFELKTNVVITSGFNVDSAVEAIMGGVPRDSTIITYR
jgi:isopentenyl phosphate kinase